MVTMTKARLVFLGYGWTIKFEKNNKLFFLIVWEKNKTQQWTIKTKKNKRKDIITEKVAAILKIYSESQFP